MTEATKQEKKQKQIGDYILGSKLGTGGFAKVVQGIHILTGEKVAVKILNMEKLKKEDKENIKKVKKEIEILKQVKHKNIIKLYDVIKARNKIYLIMELCEGGELFDQIDSKHNLTELEALKYFQEYIDAIDYLHSQKIVHRDLKPENMLLDYNQSIKLIDFGISSRYTSFLSTPCGTTSYAPPEMHEGAKYSGMLSDVWSGCIVLYTMVCGYLPFYDDDEDCHVRNILRGKFKIPSTINPLLQDLIHHCLKVNPIERYSINQIKKHPWFNLVTPVLRPGIIIGIYTIPIDETLIELVKEYLSTSTKDQIRKNVMNNQYNSITALYYILLKKKQREGYFSISDLISDEYLNFIDNQHKTMFYQINSIEDNSHSSSILNNQLMCNYSKMVVESQQCNNTPSTSILEQNATPQKDINNNNIVDINYAKQKEPNITKILNQKQKQNQRKLTKKINNQSQDGHYIVKSIKASNYHQRCLSENAQNYSISPAKKPKINKFPFEKQPIKPCKLSGIVFNDKEILFQQKKNNIFNNNRKLKRKPIQLLSNRLNQPLMGNNTNSKRTNSFDSNSHHQKIIIGLNKSLVLEKDNIPKNKRNQPTPSSSIKKNKLNNSTILSNTLKHSNMSSTINEPLSQPRPLLHNYNCSQNHIIDKTKKESKATISNQQQINFNKSKSPKAYKGFVDLRCVSFDNIENIMNKILSFFNSKQITYANVSPFKYHCSKYGEIFSLEVSLLLTKAVIGNSNNEVYYISLLSKQGNITNQNGLINQLFPL